MSVTHGSAKKAYAPIINKANKGMQKALGKFFNPETDWMVRIVDKKEAQGFKKELYDDGALLVIELNDGYESNKFISSKIYPAVEKARKSEKTATKFNPYIAEAYNEYTITVRES